MIHGFTAAYTTMRVNMIVNAFRQIGEEFCFPFAKWETVSHMAQLAIGSASLVYQYIIKNSHNYAYNTIFKILYNIIKYK